MEVLKKLGMFVGAIALTVAALLAIGLGYASWATSRALPKMQRIPQPMKVNELSGEELAALVEVYDPDFYSHKGFSSQAPGLQTITQRLVAQYYFDDYQAWLEWLPSCFDAWVLNRKMSKEDQLRLFLNSTSFGTSRDNNVQGFEQASKAFFDKTLRDLNRDEYLQILAMVADPTNYHIQSEPAANIDRSNRLAKFLDGQCKRAGVFDEELKNCAAPASTK